MMREQRRRRSCARSRRTRAARASSVGVEQQLGHADDAVHRRADLVAHRRPGTRPSPARPPRPPRPRGLQLHRPPRGRAVHVAVDAHDAHERAGRVARDREEPASDTQRHEAVTSGDAVLSPRRAHPPSIFLRSSAAACARDRRGGRRRAPSCRPRARPRAARRRCARIRDSRTRAASAASGPRSRTSPRSSPPARAAALRSPRSRRRGRSSVCARSPISSAPHTGACAVASPAARRSMAATMRSSGCETCRRTSAHASATTVRKVSPSPSATRRATPTSSRCTPSVESRTSTAPRDSTGAPSRSLPKTRPPITSAASAPGIQARPICPSIAACRPRAGPPGKRSSASPTHAPRVAAMTRADTPATTTSSTSRSAPSTATTRWSIGRSSTTSTVDEMASTMVFARRATWASSRAASAR